MKQTQAFLSTYTADVSGVCSALFELGGMTVMHDASGCNSTYHTHDEPRWYDMDSLVFISGLSELEAVMGDDEKLIADVSDAARQLHPRFIALAGTPIPMITGCDLPAIAREVAGRTNIPSFAVPSNGIGTYVAGAGQALRLYAERFITSRPEKRKNAVNILGATPLDFSVNGCVQSMARRLEEAGFTLQSVFAPQNTSRRSSERPMSSARRSEIFSRPMYLTRCGKASARERLRMCSARLPRMRQIPPLSEKA